MQRQHQRQGALLSQLLLFLFVGISVVLSNVKGAVVAATTEATTTSSSWIGTLDLQIQPSSKQVYYYAGNMEGSGSNDNNSGNHDDSKAIGYIDFRQTKFRSVSDTSNGNVGPSTSSLFHHHHNVSTTPTRIEIAIFQVPANCMTSNNNSTQHNTTLTTSANATATEASSIFEQDNGQRQGKTRRTVEDNVVVTKERRLQGWFQRPLAEEDGKPAPTPTPTTETRIPPSQSQSSADETVVSSSSSSSPSSIIDTCLEQWPITSGVGIVHPTTKQTQYCCTTELVQLGLCDEDKVSTLLLDRMGDSLIRYKDRPWRDGKFQGHYRSIEIPFSSNPVVQGDEENRVVEEETFQVLDLDESIIRLEKVGSYVVLVANCKEQNHNDGQTIEMTGSWEWTDSKRPTIFHPIHHTTPAIVATNNTNSTGTVNTANVSQSIIVEPTIWQRTPWDHNVTKMETLLPLTPTPTMTPTGTPTVSPSLKPVPATDAPTISYTDAPTFITSTNLDQNKKKRSGFIVAMTFLSIVVLIGIALFVWMGCTRRCRGHKLSSPSGQQDGKMILQELMLEDRQQQEQDFFYDEYPPPKKQTSSSSSSQSNYWEGGDNVIFEDEFACSNEHVMISSYSAEPSRQPQEEVEGCNQQEQSSFVWSSSSSEVDDYDHYNNHDNFVDEEYSSRQPEYDWSDDAAGGRGEEDLQPIATNNTTFLI